MKIKTGSLKVRLWKYFAAFAASIMLVLWILQIVFLQTYYQSMKLSEVEKIGKSLMASANEEDFQDIMDDTTYETGVFAILLTESGKVETSQHMFAHRIQGMGRGFDEIIHEINNSKNGIVKKTYPEGREKGAIAVFAAKLKVDGKACYLIVNAPLAPVDATTQVLQSQLLIVTVISLLFAFVLSYFLAKKMAAPVVKISETAGELAKGNYKINFEGGGYTEVNTLAGVLNHATEELGKTDKLRRDLVANVSHDLRTPLTIIKSYAEMIRDISGNNPEKRDAHTKVIIDEADRLTLLVKDMLDLSILEAGTGSFKMEIFNLSDTLRSMLMRFKLMEEQEGYNFEVTCEEDIYICADEQRIEQVIFNYIGNAVNYTGEDKRIIIKLMKKEGKAHFSVTDTGQGIEPEKLEKVWERYYKASGSMKRQAKGTGIGLSIVKEILQAHNAGYGADSTVGQGSTFWFEFKLENE